MQIFAMIAGLDDFAISVMIEPQETVATLFDKYEKRLLTCKMPHQFTAAYSIEHTRPGGFSDDPDDNDVDYIGMQNGDPDVVAKYLTPAARLDPAKTMADYFGTGAIPETISIALTWPAEFTAQEKRARELASIEFDERLPKARERSRLVPRKPVETETSTQIAAHDDQISPPTMARSTTACSCPWHWLASCLHLAARSCSNIVHHEEDAKKND